MILSFLVRQGFDFAQNAGEVLVVNDLCPVDNKYLCNLGYGGRLEQGLYGYVNFESRCYPGNDPRVK